MFSTGKKTYFLLTVLSLLIFCGCNTPLKEGVYKGDDIPADKAKMLHELNNKLFKAIKTDRDDAELLFSKEFLDKKRSKVQFDHINRLRNDNEYYLLKDYYIVNTSDDRGLIAINHPEITYTPLAKEMYLAFFVPRQKQNKTMLTVVYANYNYGWKANEIALGYYTQRGKTAGELLEMAKQDYANGYLVNAINNITLAANATASKYLKDPGDEEISSFSQRLYNEANEKVSYPLVLNDVSTKPAVITVSGNAMEDAFYQYIYYITKLKITDTVALKRENEQVKRALVKTFPGINKGDKTIVYSAMNQKPIVGKAIPHFDIEEKISDQ